MSCMVLVYILYGYYIVLSCVSVGNYSRLACEFYFARDLGYYVIHIYVLPAFNE